MARHADIDNDRRCGFEFITARALDRLGTAGVIEKLKERVGDANVYISVDIDVLDPAYAPGKSRSCFGGRVILMHYCGDSNRNGRARRMDDARAVDDY